MSECAYYKVRTTILESREISQNRPPAQHVQTPYCTHPESPAPLDFVTKVLGGGRVLQCQGLFAKCQLPGGFHE